MPGEIKKSVFGYLNYCCRRAACCRCIARPMSGRTRRRAIFFGLSGTGKTTLSADDSRTLIGDDEHGWSAKGSSISKAAATPRCINLSPTAEPEIYATVGRSARCWKMSCSIRRRRMPDVDDDSLTENTRACYPLDFIPNADPTGMAAHPENVVMLTADAFGVMPPIAKLTAEQAMYHFLSGYTAQVAGTEKGLGNEPKATFSTCFGAPFMPRHPRSTPRCSASASPRTRLAMLARQHRLVGRRLWRRRADDDRAYPGVVARGARRPARGGAGAAGAEFRPPGAGELPRGAEGRARSAQHLVGQGAPTMTPRAT